MHLNVFVKMAANVTRLPGRVYVCLVTVVTNVRKNVRMENMASSVRRNVSAGTLISRLLRFSQTVKIPLIKL